MRGCLLVTEPRSASTSWVDCSRHPGSCKLYLSVCDSKQTDGKQANPYKSLQSLSVIAIIVAFSECPYRKLIAVACFNTSNQSVCAYIRARAGACPSARALQSVIRECVIRSKTALGQFLSDYGRIAITGQKQHWGNFYQTNAISDYLALKRVRSRALAYTRAKVLQFGW